MSKIKVYVKVKKHYILDKNLNTTKKLSNQYKILSEIKSYDILNDKYYGPKIYDFVKYLIRQNVNITYLCNNLKTLKIEVQSEKDFPFKNILAYYNSSKNIIVFNGVFNELTLYHELFHVATTYYNDNKTLLFSGLSFDNGLTGGIRFGMGINEGYTDKIENEFFSNNGHYSYGQCIVEKLEKIVGKKELKRLYFDCNLFGLINLLEKYAQKPIILEFIKNVDYIYNCKIDYNDDLKNIIETKLVDINQFLADCFTKKYTDDSRCFYKNKFELLKSLFDLPNSFHHGFYDMTFTINNLGIRKNILSIIEIEENKKTNNKYKCKTKLIR